MDLKSSLKLVEVHLKTFLKKENIFILGAILLTIILSLWIFSTSSSPGLAQGTEEADIGLVIPSGQLIVPLELANASALNALVSRNAVIDVFKPGESGPMVEGLRIIKLNAGEGPLFGALVPERLAGSLQNIFSNPKLRGAIRATKSGPTEFHTSHSTKSNLIEVPIGD